MREVDKFSMADAATAKCPFGYYSAMRKDEPVHLDPGTGLYWVTRFDDVRNFSLMDAQYLSASSGLVIRKHFQPRTQALLDAAGIKVVDTLVTSDPPRQEDFRLVGISLFDKRRVDKEIAPRVELLVHQFIDKFMARGSVDFINDFAVPLQGTILCEEFGIPLVDMPRFKQWSDAVFEIMTPGLDENREVELIKRYIELFQYLEDRLNHAHELPPGRILHTLATVMKRDGTPFSSLERRWMAVVTFAGGIDTTRNMLVTCMHKLAVSPELQTQIRGNPEKINQFVEEMLRLDGSVQGITRVATSELPQNDGTVVPVGANLIVSVGSANRDPEIWEHPDEFRLERDNLHRHIGFGIGRHLCIGMHLARSELQIAMRVLLDRLGDIRLAIPEGEIDWVPAPYFRQIVNLPIKFSPATKGSEP